jgi:cysteamine dioxygenase
MYYSIMPVVAVLTFPSTISVVLLTEIDSSEVVWLEELEDHQPPEGFVVARGLYKGPVIRR